ncbi:MAG TPA: hypothetical protein VGQ09_20245 [Chitinophagaceae bacterium]|jgi:hypothetical protein|nr:hypothetical protein [Chitinophagaceae bacterium]
MKKIISALVFLFSMVNYTLAQKKALFINPIFTERNVKLYPEAEGVWAFDFIGNISIQKKGDNFYHLRYGNENHPSLYEAVFFQMQNQGFLDLYGTNNTQGRIK